MERMRGDEHVNQNSYKPYNRREPMKKAVTLILFLLISYLSASQIEVTAFIFTPEEPQPGESVTILVRLTNKSYDVDVEVTCRLFIDGSLYDVKVVPVNRRSSSEVSFVWPAYPGDHEFALEMSYYVERTELTDTFVQYLDVPGTEEQIDYFSQALSLYQQGSYLQAKIMFQQAKRVFEEAQDMDQATVCEEYILRCDQYYQAAQLYEQAETAYAQEDLNSALMYYQQAQSVYHLLEDDKATLCEQRIQEIYEKQRKQAEPPYYLILLIPVAAAVIAGLYLRKKKSPPHLPDYVPEQRLREEKPKKLFAEDTEKPEIAKKLDRIESGLDTSDIQTFKTLVRDFKKQEILLDKEELTPDEAASVKESLDTVKEKIKEKGKKLQDTQKLKDLQDRVELLLDEPVEDLVDAYNKYAQLHNAFDQIPDLGTAEQEEVRAKLREYYQFIQHQAKSVQSEMQ